MVGNAAVIIKRFWILVIIIVLLIIAALYLAFRGGEVVENRAILVFSPHYGDATLALGGYLSQNKDVAMVASFFTESTNPTDDIKLWAEDNKKALEILGNQSIDLGYRGGATSTEMRSEITKDMQRILASFGNKQVSVYGPSYFGELSHPDHMLVYEAYVDLIKNYPDTQDVTFYFYEDFPYIVRHSQSAGISLQGLLEREAEFFLEQTPLFLNRLNVVQKKQSLDAYTEHSSLPELSISSLNVLTEAPRYTESRCQGEENSVCEMVYRVVEF